MQASFNQLYGLVRPLFTDAVFPLDLALSLLVTLHVLLRKREVPTAVGWIGFAWIAPVTGAISYYVFGINRVRRRAQNLRPAHRRRTRQKQSPPAGHDAFAALADGIGRLTSRQIAPGNDVQTYQDGDAAYPPMIAAIAAAQSTVGLSSYIFRNDVWGGRFIDALIAAHARGVDVRVLIDGLGGGWLRARAYHRLRRGGVKAARFLHSVLPWRMPFINLRSHRKLLVVDGKVAFTGGMNIADENVLATGPRKPVRDTHFCMKGPVVRQFAEAFLLDWCFVTGQNIEDDAWFPDLAARGEVPARVIDSGPDEDIEKIEFAVLQAISCAQRSVAVMTPYFLPDERIVTALALARMRGVAVDILVPAENDHVYVDWAMRANVGPLLAAGVQIWFAPPPFRHSKLMVVDEEWCLVGSGNWDIRSFRLNFELCVELYDRTLAASLSSFMQQTRGAPLTQAVLEARPVLVRLRDAAVRLMLPYL